MTAVLLACTTPQCTGQGRDHSTSQYLLSPSVVATGRRILVFFFTALRIVQAKIETLENQVTKLTAQARALAAEKEDLNGRAAKLTDLLQARDRALVTLTTQLSQIRCSGGGEPASSPQLTLTYCNPPLVLTTLQVAPPAAPRLVGWPCLPAG